MKDKKTDKDLKDIFKTKLEEAEVIPSVSTENELMRRLAKREFMRFNPLRFNIFYAGAVTALGIAAFFLLSQGQDKKSAEGSGPDTTLVQKGIDTIIHKGAEIIIPRVITDNAEQKDLAGYDNARSSEAGNEVMVKKTNSALLRGNKDKPDLSVSESRQVTNTLLYQPDPGRNGIRKNFTRDGSAITSSVTSGCVPLKVRFSSYQASADSCLWTFGDGGISHESDPEWIFDVAGEYKVVLILFFKDGSEKPESLNITVYPVPAARFEINPAKAIIPDDEIRFSNYSSDAVSYKWKFGDGSTSDLFEPVYRYKTYGRYDITLTAISDKGCRDSVTVNDAFSESGYFIEFPNAFIPNPGGPTDGFYSRTSDESARIFHPEASGVINFNLKIFSKVGMLIFESNDINAGWDGYYKGQLSDPGVYIWKVRGTFTNGEPFTKMGDLTLLKNGH